MTPTEKKRIFWGKMIWISAISLVISVCLAFVLPALGIIFTFHSARGSGGDDLKRLVGDVSTWSLIGWISLPFAFAALVLFIIAIVRHRKFSNPNQAG